MNNEDQPTKQQPIKVFSRYPLDVAVFRHRNSDGSHNHTVSHSRSYKDKAGQWANTNVCHREHCLTLAKLYTEAESFIAELEQQDYELAKGSRNVQEVA